MAKLALWGDTALEWYGYASAEHVPRTYIDGDEEEDFLFREISLSYLESLNPAISKPYHIVAFSRQTRRSHSDARCHTLSPSARLAPFLKVASGIYAPSPELAFLQACRGSSLASAIVAGSRICASYGLAPDTDTVVGRPACTSCNDLLSAARLHHDVPGCALARQAIPWIIEGAASPRELALGLIVSLPHRMGGYGLPKPDLNYRIDLALRAVPLARKTYYVADVCWPDERLVLEYDSDERHLTSERLQEDAVKRMALEAMGYFVITVGRLQMNSIDEMDRIALATARKMGRGLRPRLRDFKAKQMALRESVGLPKGC